MDNNPWAEGDGPLPDNPGDLIIQILVLAARRREDADTHPASCTCDGCYVRKVDANMRELHQRIANGARR